MVMTEEQKQEILSKAKTFTRKIIAENHLRNTKKLKNLKEFKVNPFLLAYLANYLTGDSSPESIARVLVYGRALVTSINTSFGTNMQTKFCSQVLSGTGSTTTGIDLEYIDALDGRKKYCQVKLGPDTINADDVTTIINHFNSVKNLAITNASDVRLSDLIVGVLYGEPEELSAHYKKIKSQNYIVLTGGEFWHHFTGDENFYNELVDSFAEVAEETDGREVMEEVIHQLAEDIKTKGEVLGLL